MPPGPQQGEEDAEAWATHHASQSPNVLSSGQVNGLVVVVFCSSFLLNSAFSGPGAASAKIENFVLLLMMSMIGLVWAVLLYKMRECLVWPEQVRFLRDGRVVIDIGCGSRELDTRDGGVTLFRKRVNACNSNLGVWCNAITDKSRDQVCLLVPTTGPRFWRGFAFQPEDEGAFLHDCRHAGIAIVDCDSGAGFAMSDARSLEQGLLSNEAAAPPLLAVNMRDSFDSSDSEPDRFDRVVSPLPTEVEWGGDSLSVDGGSDEEETSNVELELKNNNNIIQV